MSTLIETDSDRHLVDSALAIADSTRVATAPKGTSAEQLRTALAQAVTAGWDARRHELNAAIDFHDLDVLEIGCGQCWHAPLLLAGGARSYKGLDIQVPFDNRAIPDIRASAAAHTSDRERLTSPVSLGEYLAAFEQIDVHEASITAPPWEPACVDAAFMLTVTEHLPDVRAGLDAIANLLRPGGQLYITHGNYYAWSGHHVHPQSEAGFDPHSPAHRAVVDWGHVRRFVDSAQIDTLNFIRMHELVELLERRFEIVEWHLVPLAEGRGAGRLTPELRRQFPGYSEEELTTELAVYLCRLRDGPARAPAREAPRTPADHVVTRDGDTTRVRLTWCSPESGHCHWTRIPGELALPGARLIEDGRPLGPADALHAAIRETGGGAYSLWGDYLYFSSSDGGDPAGNGRTYELLVPGATAEIGVRDA